MSKHRVGSTRRDFGALAGPVTEPPAGPYRVCFQKLATDRGKTSKARTMAIVALNVLIEVAFVLWLLAPEHHPDFDGTWQMNAANGFVVGAVALVEVLRLINVFSLSLASLVARDPVPVRPDPALRVAFLTTIVPGKEPLRMVQTTLRAARKIRHGGRFDVWLLDEGNTREVRAMCAVEGVRHFSRKGVEDYNQPKGAFKAKTKHGNYNAWLDAHGHLYDVFVSVDPDHVPVPEYADRMLGYFRDPDIAFVVGPQCYANVDNFVTKAAESQQFPFHSVIQRAGNAYGVAMLVGTNNAVRIDALGCVGGLYDSITEDMATGLAIHSRRNPETGARWRSVYTPDVVAVGEGPSSWGDYFGQQMRWSRGTFELLRGPVLATPAPPRRHAPAALPADRGLLPVDGPGLGARPDQRRAVPHARRVRDHRPAAAVARALRRRDAVPAVGLHPQPPPQRQPVRGPGLTGPARHGDERAHGAHLRGGADLDDPAPAGPVRRHREGRGEQPRLPQRVSGGT